jgi:hypothetical protein
VQLHALVVVVVVLLVEAVVLWLVLVFAVMSSVDQLC